MHTERREASKSQHGHHNFFQKNGLCLMTSYDLQPLKATQHISQFVCKLIFSSMAAALVQSEQLRKSKSALAEAAKRARGPPGAPAKAKAKVKDRKEREPKAIRFLANPEFEDDD